MQRVCELCNQPKVEGSKHDVEVYRVHQRAAYCPDCEEECDHGCLLEPGRFLHYCQDCDIFFDRKHGRVDLD